MDSAALDRAAEVLRHQHEVLKSSTSHNFLSQLGEAIDAISHAGSLSKVAEDFEARIAGLKKQEQDLVGSIKTERDKAQKVLDDVKAKARTIEQDIQNAKSQADRYVESRTAEGNTLVTTARQKAQDAAGEIQGKLDEAARAANAEVERLNAEVARKRSIVGSLDNVIDQVNQG